MSEATTQGVRVATESFFIPERSSDEHTYYFFAYRIRITNDGDETVQLISRHWIITNAHGEVQEVRGPGVVGAQPVLMPGQHFEYTSFCPLNTPVGAMHGTFQMIRPDGGEPFDATVAPFTLAVPHALN